MSLLFDLPPITIVSRRQEDLVARIPRYSSGRIKGEHGKHLEKTLRSFSFSDAELAMFEEEIRALASYFGHEGKYPLKTCMRR